MKTARILTPPIEAVSPLRARTTLAEHVVRLRALEFTALKRERVFLTHRPMARYSGVIQFPRHLPKPAAPPYDRPAREPAMWPWGLASFGFVMALVLLAFWTAR